MRGSDVVVDRIERHDVANAVMLAAVLLLLGLGTITAMRSLFSTVDEGLVLSEKTLESEEAPTGATATTDPTDSSETSAIIAARPPDEVLVRVANGARRAGVAGAGTETLQAAGYPTLSPKNGPTLDTSVVYYISGYAADAVKVAEVLGLQPTQIEPMPSDPGVPLEEAKIVAILGVNSNY
ncbi:MAG: LytR C-terminal domain-containing protein [Actinomycetia bacterium]|nr:LytR C-terminal domain-containing protein [Actinomycetes bacterium]